MPTNLDLIPGDTNAFRYRDRTDGDVVEVEIRYLKGSTPKSRGVYLFVCPVTVGEDTETRIVPSGHRAQVRRLKRANPSQLRAIADAADAHVVELAGAYRSDPNGAGRTAFERLARELVGALEAVSP